MTITTRWNRFFDWRDADISETDVLKNIKQPSICFLSANAFGLKGKLPGGKHSWISSFDGERWKTYEISDIETIDVQNANIIFAKNQNYTERQLIISDRVPSTMWFGNKPRLDYVSPYFQIDCNEYPLNQKIDLINNNCSTFLSYIVWKYNLNFEPKYIGFKSKIFWECQQNEN